MSSIAKATAGLAAVTQLFTSSALAQPAPFAPKEFSDVGASSPYFESVEYLREHNIIRGYTDGTFRPEQRISRAEFVMLATNPLFLQGDRVNDCLRTHIGSGATVFFPDVRSDEWYANAVCAAKVNNLVNGYPDGSFAPGHTIIVAEAAKIAAKLFVIDVRRDNDGVDEKWYNSYVQAVGGRNAFPTSIKKVTQPITRGEMAEILFRLKTQRTDKASTSWQALTEG